MLIDRSGGPDVFQAADLPDPAPEPGEVVIRQEAVGLNFIDVYRRTGLYPMAFPAILGSEGAGVVTAVGEGVTRVAEGDRAAYGAGAGAYADMVKLSERAVVKLPAAVSTRVAAAAMLKGMTAEFLTKIWPLVPGDAVLVHAAAGGVGSILTQWLSHLGMQVIATVGSDAKAAAAKDHGAAHTILYDEEDVAAKVRAFTDGAGVKVAYDSVGKTTFDASLASLARRGLLVSFGNASGAPAPIAPLRLAQGGSLFLTRPTLFDYIATPEALDKAAGALFDVIASGAVKIDIGREWPLAEVADAHRALEARETSGPSLLIP
jgi:NADPH2:quinone reductase